MTNQKIRASFILHTDSLSILEKMTDEQAGIFIKTLYNYRIYQTLPPLDFGMEMAITPFINQFIRDEEKYQNICKRNAENGCKGGRPANPEEPKKPTGLTENPEEPKKPINDNKSGTKSYPENETKSSNHNIIINHFNQVFDKKKYQSGSDREKVIKQINDLFKKGDSVDNIKNLIDYKKANPNTQQIELSAWLNSEYGGVNMAKAKEWVDLGKPMIKLYKQNKTTDKQTIAESIHRCNEQDFSNMEGWK